MSTPCSTELRQVDFSSSEVPEGITFKDWYHLTKFAQLRDTDKGDDSLHDSLLVGKGN